MGWLRRTLRAWLGVPNADDIIHIARREIDADAAWRDGPSAITHATRRKSYAADREAAIRLGRREDTRVSP